MNRSPESLVARACSAASTWAWTVSARTASSSATRPGKWLFGVPVPPRHGGRSAPAAPSGRGRRTPAGLHQDGVAVVLGVAVSGLAGGGRSALVIPPGYREFGGLPPHCAG